MHSRLISKTKNDFLKKVDLSTHCDGNADCKKRARATMEVVLLSGGSLMSTDDSKVAAAIQNQM
jgi:hypothetical protein